MTEITVAALQLAFGEELLWDKLVWHERSRLFGEGGPVLPADVLALVVPLLALPQATHYVLDAFVWKAGKDAALLVRLGWSSRAPEGSPRVSPAPSPMALASTGD